MIIEGHHLIFPIAVPTAFIGTPLTNAVHPVFSFVTNSTAEPDRKRSTSISSMPLHAGSPAGDCVPSKTLDICYQIVNSCLLKESRDNWPASLVSLKPVFPHSQFHLDWDPHRQSRFHAVLNQRHHGFLFRNSHVKNNFVVNRQHHFC